MADTTHHDSHECVRHAHGDARVERTPRACSEVLVLARIAPPAVVVRELGERYRRGELDADEVAAIATALGMTPE